MFVFIERVAQNGAVVKFALCNLQSCVQIPVQFIFCFNDMIALRSIVSLALLRFVLARRLRRTLEGSYNFMSLISLVSLAYLLV